MSEFSLELQFTLFKEVATFSIQLRDFISVIFIKKVNSVWEEWITFKLF